MGSPGRTCQDEGKTHFERHLPMPKWGKQQQAEPPRKAKPAPGGEDRKRRLGTEKGCSCDTDVAAEVERQAGGRSQTASARGSAGTPASVARAAGRGSSRCSRPSLAGEGPGTEATRTAGTSARTWRSPRQESSSSQNSSSFCQGAGIVRGMGGRGSRIVTVGTSPFHVALRSCGSEPRVTVPRATSGGVD